MSDINTVPADAEGDSDGGDVLLRVENLEIGRAHV